MKVKRLIEILQQQNPDEIVYLIGGSGKGDPLDEIMVGVTHRVEWKDNVCNDVQCFGIYGE